MGGAQWKGGTATPPCPALLCLLCSACRLDMVWHKLRSKARYVDEMEDSAALLEKNAQAVLKRLGQMDRTLAHRRHDLSVQLAALSGHPATHMDSPRGQVGGVGARGGGQQERWLGRRGPRLHCACTQPPPPPTPTLPRPRLPTWQELLELAGAGGDLAACPRLTPDAAAALLDMQRDVEFWKGSIAQERDALHRMWDSLSYIQTCIKKARADIGDLQRRKAALELATLWRPAVRRT